MSNLNVKNRTVFNKDNLDVLRGINSNSIDLIYLDPPFNKKKVFTAPIGSSAEGAEFNDIFREEDIKDEWVSSIYFENMALYSFLQHTKYDGISYNYCYLVYMAIRLIECKRILKDTGSVYLHCDPTMSHYIKVVMDCIFEENNFKNEIVWHYRTYQGKVENYYPKKHDIILVYLKSHHGKVIKNLEYTDNYQETVDYKRWKKFFVEGNKIKFNYYPESDSRFTAYLNRWIKDNGRKPQADDVIYECNGYVVDDVFTDIQAIDPKDKKERIGYPTQKPLSLLERIIRSSSNEGDVVLDPFCGCATTCVAAEKLGRQWIGIDVSYKAFEVLKERLNKEISDDLWDGKKELIFSTTPPARDSAITDEERGFVYIISNPAFAGVYKVGIAKNVKQRLNAYQTSDPNRGYKIEREYKCSNYIEVEKLTHANFNGDREHEWVRAKLADIINFIESKIEA